MLCQPCIFAPCLDVPMSPCGQDCDVEAYTLRVDQRREAGSSGGVVVPSARGAGVADEGGVAGRYVSRSSNGVSAVGSRQRGNEPPRENGAGVTAARDLLSRIDHFEEEVYALTALRQTACACLEAAVAREAAQGEFPTGELDVKVVEAVCEDARPTEGLDVRIEMRHGSQKASTTLGPTRSWAAAIGKGGRPGGVHVAWNELFRFDVPRSSASCAPLCVSVFREDGVDLASIEFPLSSLDDQKVHHEWMTLGCGWRLHVAMQLVASASELLRRHVAEFDAKLTVACDSLEALQANVHAFAPTEAEGTTVARDCMEGDMVDGFSCGSCSRYSGGVEVVVAPSREMTPIREASPLKGWMR